MSSSDNSGAGSENDEGKVLSLGDPKTRRMIEDAELNSSLIFHHGFFPKEIVRYLEMRLKDEDIPCERGFDRKILEEHPDIAITLRQKYKDANPYYFVAFPIENLSKARKILDETSYPIPESTEAEREAERLIKRKKQRAESTSLKKMLMYLFFLCIAGLGLFAFICLAKEILY